MLLRILVYILVLFLLIQGIMILTVMTLGWIDEARMAECPEHDPDPEGATAEALWNNMKNSNKYGMIGDFQPFLSRIEFPEEILIHSNNGIDTLRRQEAANGGIFIVYKIYLSCGKTEKGAAVVSRCGSVDLTGFEATCSE